MRILKRTGLVAVAFGLAMRFLMPLSMDTASPRSMGDTLMLLGAALLAAAWVLHLPRLHHVEAEGVDWDPNYDRFDHFPYRER